jgi:hypothetical protein
MNDSMNDSCSGSYIRHTVSYPSGGGCVTGRETLNSFPWLPFGLNAIDGNHPDRWLGNEAYSCAPANPTAGSGGNFWGWTPFFHLFDQILPAAESAGIPVQEFGLQNELNLQDFTVTARPSEAAGDCGSVCGDVGTYLQSRGLTGNLAMFGETERNSTIFACDLTTPAMVQESANGYLASTLYSSDGVSVVLRPWEDAASTNCRTPANIGSPSGPYAP